MAEDAQLKVVIQVDASGQGAEKVLSDLERVKAGATSASETVTTFANAEAKAGSEAEVSGAKLSTMRETVQGLNAAAHGSFMGLARAAEGIAKISGASSTAMDAIKSMSAALGAVGVGLSIGTAVVTAIYKNIVTPIWDAVDAYKALNDPVAKAYEEQKKINRQIIETNSLKLREVIAEINGVTTALVESEKQAAETRKALNTLADAESELESAKVKNLEITGRISPVEAKAYQANIQYAREMNKLLQEQAEAKRKIQELDKSRVGDTPERRDAQALLAAVNTRIEGRQQQRVNEQIELGKDSQKVLSDLRAAIKQQEASVSAARTRLAESQGAGGRAGSVSDQSAAYADLQKQEQLLQALKSQMDKVGTTMKASLESAGANVTEGLEALTSRVQQAGGQAKAGVEAEAEQTSADINGAADTAKKAMTTANGQVSASITTFGSEVSGAVKSMGGQFLSAIKDVKQSISLEVAAAQAEARKANANANLALKQIESSR